MPGSRLLDQVRNRIRTLHYSRSTEKTYCYWIRYFIRYFHYRHPRDMGAREITIFLTFLATQRNVSASTQNQAFNALLFLYRKVLEIELDRIENVVRARTSQGCEDHPDLHPCAGERGERGAESPGGCGVISEPGLTPWEIASLCSQ